MNDEGEFELVLGNKQLFSVFFIVVVLLGVCFLMGYVVGKNSAPVLSAAIAPPGDREPLVIPPATEPPVTKAKEAPPVEAPVKETAAQAAPDAAEKSKKAAAVVAAQPEPVKAAPAPTPAPEKQVKATLPAFQPEKAAKSAAPKQAPIGSQPVAGRVYLQLSATDRDSAEGMADLLRSKSFSAIAAQIPERPELYRVLVGPLAEGDIAKTRANLKASSFPADEAVRRVF